MKFRWTIHADEPLAARRLASAIGVHPLLGQCLLNRGLTDGPSAELFLAPRLKRLSDPFLLPDMEAAVECLVRNRSERIVIFGDYDVDGVTSCAILTEVLNALGFSSCVYLPHRLEEGYGLSEEGVTRCRARSPGKVLLAVDCGSTASVTIEQLRRDGIEVVVLDHHQVSDPPPPATALVNPRRTSGGRVHELCSAGLAFKLAHALLKRGRELGWREAFEFDLRRVLDLVALGTIADLVPLAGENRILVSSGLARLNATERPGLLALRKVAGIQGTIGVYEVGFQLGPRLNAAGRLENATAALDLLLASAAAQAEQLALELNQRNTERQRIERSIAETAIRAVEARFDPARDYVIVEGQMLWHIGVVGIVASRVLRHFYRPTIIVGGESDEWRGSGRSIEGFDLAGALRENSDLLIRHGGHAMAAGLAIRPDRLDALRTRLNELARRSLRPEDLIPVLRIDAIVPLEELTFELLGCLEALQPTGQGNQTVQLAVRGVTHAREPERLGKNSQHLKLWVTDGQRTIESVWWNCPDGCCPSGRFDLAFVPEINSFNGRQSVQLRVLDWRPAT